MRRRTIRRYGNLGLDVSTVFDGTQIWPVPLMITKSQYESGLALSPTTGSTVRMARNQDEDFDHEDLLGIDTRATSLAVAVWEESVLTGIAWDERYDNIFYNNVNADTRNQGRRIVSAMGARIDLALASPTPLSGIAGKGYTGIFDYPNYPADDPRLIKIAVCESGNVPQQIGTTLRTFNSIKFAKAYVEDCYRDSGEFYLQFRLIPD